MILGVGIDVVDVARFGATLDRTPAMRERLFTPREWAFSDPDRGFQAAYRYGGWLLFSAPGLALVMGRVRGFPRTAERAAAGFKVPHMGWNQVRQVRPHALWRGIPDEARFYFVHSYYCDPREPSLAAGETRYPDAFTSAIARDNIFATQFHPEKSATAGLTLLGNFSTWDP